MCVEVVGLFYATQTGNPEAVAEVIAAATGLEATPVEEVDVGDLAAYDGLIVGTPTWNTGVDEFRSGTTWGDYLEDITDLDLKGTPVAVFGCGDQEGYADNFCDAIQGMHAASTAAGASMLGQVGASGYEHAESKSEVDGKVFRPPVGRGQSGRPDPRSSERLGHAVEEGGHAVVSCLTFFRAHPC